MIYTNGDYVKLTNGMIGILLKSNTHELYWLRHRLGDSPIILNMISHKIDPKEYAIQMKKCSCGDYTYEDFFNFIDGEELCPTCYEIVYEQRADAVSDIKTERELYNWSKI